MNAAPFPAPLRQAFTERGDGALDQLGSMTVEERGLASLNIDISEDMEREFQPLRKELTMDGFQQAQNYDRTLANQGVGIVKETPFTRLGGAVERLRKAHAHVLGVAGKLCGETPTEGKDATSRVTGSGMFGGIEELADSITDMAGEIMDHAERINRRI